MSDFEIFALSAGGGTLGLSSLPGGAGDYAADLQSIRDWQPEMVISMTTEFEMTKAGARHLGKDLNGSRWSHLPVPDFGAPPANIQVQWESVGELACRTLQQGGRVLVHCRGGCGRSGMAVLRLMIETGEEPSKALARLRETRPCAVETDAQLAWARGARARALRIPASFGKTRWPGL